MDTPTANKSDTCCPILHHAKLAPQFLKSIARTGKLKGAYVPHTDLTFVTVHNYSSPSLFERSLDHVGVGPSGVALRPPDGTEWRNTLKVELLLDYIESGRCLSELLMYCDGSDVVLMGPPGQIVRIFREYDCDLLFMSTNFQGGYMCMPDVKKWADRIYPRRYLNAGVFIGRPSMIAKVLGRAKEFIEDEPMSRSKYIELGRGIADTRLCDHLPDFPRGLFSDQVILRYIHPEFHPRMKVDYTNRLAFRNGKIAGRSPRLSSLLEEPVTDPPNTKP